MPSDDPDYWIIPTYKAHSERAVHTDRNCRALDQARAVRPAMDHEIDAADVCDYCTDSVATGGEQDWSAYNDLVAAAKRGGR